MHVGRNKLGDESCQGESGKRLPDVIILAKKPHEQKEEYSKKNGTLESLLTWCVFLRSSTKKNSKSLIMHANTFAPGINNTPHNIDLSHLHAGF